MESKEKKVESKQDELKVNAQFAEGFRQGFESGIAANVRLEEVRKNSFHDGIRHIVTLAEDYMAEELGFSSRGDLIEANRSPAWWNRALLSNYFTYHKPSPTKDGRRCRT